MPNQIEEDPQAMLSHQYELEKELRERTVKELQTQAGQLSELYGARNEHNLRIDRLEQAEKRRVWWNRALVGVTISLVTKLAWPLLVAIAKVVARGATP